MNQIIHPIYHHNLKCCLDLGLRKGKSLSTGKQMFAHLDQQLWLENLQAGVESMLME